MNNEISSITISPTEVGLAGGEFTITGSGFSEVNQVTFGGEGASKITVTEDGNKITGTTPSFPSCDVGEQIEIKIYFNGVPKLYGKLIIVTGPEIYLSIPAEGSLGGGTSLTIIGSGLNNASVVTVGSIAAADLNVSDDGTTITCTTSPFPTSDVDNHLDILVSVLGRSVIAPDKFVPKEPVLTGITPKDGLLSGGTFITLRGYYLQGVESVQFGDIQITEGITVEGDNVLTVTTPKGINAGATDVTVVVQGEKSNAVAFSYELKDRIPLNIDTSTTNLPTDTQVYMYVVGEMKLKDGSTKFYRLDGSGCPKEMLISDNSQRANTFPGSTDLTSAAATSLEVNYPNDWADYSIPIQNDGSTSINLANINAEHIEGLGTGEQAFSGRIYLSVGIPKIPFTVNSSGYAQPSFYEGAGKYTLFDWVEFSFDSSQNFNGNTTMVDQFGLSLALEVSMPDQVLQVGLNSTTLRDGMISVEDAIYSAGRVTAPLETTETPPFGKKAAYPSIINVNTGYLLRSCSPSTIAANSKINVEIINYFEDTINQWYETWKTVPLVIAVSQATYYSAMVKGDELQFKIGKFTTDSDWKIGPSVEFTFNTKITSAEIWQCNGVLASGTTAAKNAGKIIAAAFNRGVMDNIIDDLKVSATDNGFYPLGSTYNQWASLAHQYSIGNLAYGFAYDDVCDQNPTIALSQPNSITITLGRFK